MSAASRKFLKSFGLLRAGHPDIGGLCMALSDWSAELCLLQNEERETLNRDGR